VEIGEWTKGEISKRGVNIISIRRRIIPLVVSCDGFGIRVKEKFVAIEAVSLFLRPVGAIYYIAITLSTGNSMNKDMPYIPCAMFVRVKLDDITGFFVLIGIKEQQEDPTCISGEDGKITPTVGKCCPEKVRAAWFDAKIASFFGEVHAFSSGEDFGESRRKIPSRMASAHEPHPRI
jgi:hypothetical protein